MKIDPSQISAARRRANMTQRELAAALDVTVQAVSQWENGKTDATPRIVNLAKALNCSVDFLLNKEKGLIHHNIEFTPRNDMVPLLCLADVPLYFDQSEPDLAPESNMTLYTTIPKIGWMFAIEVVASSEHFANGDLLIFDSGVTPMPGDYAFLLGIKSGRTHVALSSSKRISYKEALPLVVKMPKEDNVEFEIDPIPVAQDFEKLPPNVTVVLAGTLVEHRTFRRPRHAA